MYDITLRHGLFLMVILHVAKCAYVTKCTLQNSGQFMRSLEISGTDDVEENIPEYAIRIGYSMFCVGYGIYTRERSSRVYISLQTQNIV